MGWWGGGRAESSSEMGLVMVGVCLLVAVVAVVQGGEVPGMVMVQEEGGRVRREVGPPPDLENQDNGINNKDKNKERKYRRLEHSILVQGDIRSR